MTTNTSPARPGSTGRAQPATSTEQVLAELLGMLLAVDRVPVDAHFFDHLGADSMLMARFCAQVRKRSDLGALSMRDIYRHPTVRSLALVLADPPSSPVVAARREPTSPPARVSTSAYLWCGVFQLLAVLSYSWLAAAVLIEAFAWVAGSTDLTGVYQRAVVAGAAVWVGSCLLPIAAKWLLVGRWRPQEIRVWSTAYLRFWVVKTLTRSNPLVLFVGSPLYVGYLRALGARIGPGALVLTRHLPVCTDLLTVGAGAVVRKDTFLTCYRAEAGVIQTGPVTLGREAVVGEAAVLDIHTSLGDRAELSHSSSLQAGQTVPAGQRRDGFAGLAQASPTPGRLGQGSSGAVRPVAYTVLQLLALLLVYLPLSIGGLVLLVPELPPMAVLAGAGADSLASWTFYRDALVVAGVLYAAFLVLALAFVLTVPRLLNLALQPDRTYRMYGFRYWVHRAIELLTNPAFFPRLLGDSSYVVPYLRWLGYDLSDVEQTGSNFGLEVKHENPYLCTVGRGTMVADGLSMINTDISHRSFRLTRTSIGSRSFLGNYVVFPPQARTGDDCLLATKVMVPVSGETRSGIGLLGSPAFEIPRSVQRDGRLDHLTRGDGLRRRLSAKNRHNAVSIVLYLLAWWLFLAGLLVLAAAAAASYAVIGALAFAIGNLGVLALRIGWFVLVERASTAFRPLQPLLCSIYDERFWRHERFWKLATQPLILDGTPFKNLTWRLLGVRIGRRVFDDGCAIVEKTMTSIGDDCTLGTRSVVQAHSQEDGTFKSDRISIGAGCTLGIGALVHYGATMGAGSSLAPDSFLMKGEEIPPRARWGGNPAQELR